MTVDAIILSCEDVRRELSNYLEDDVTPDLRARIAAHLEGCRLCTAVFDGMGNVVRLYNHAGVLDLPTGFSARLQLRLVAAGLAG